MKITRVEPIVVAIPYSHAAPKPPMGTGQPRTTMDAVYLRVETDAGITGWGECYGFAACAATATVVNGVLAPMAAGRDPTDIAPLMADFHRRFQGLGRNGPGAFALAGFDIALWDIAGKIAGKPIHRLLGGDGARSHIHAYASVLRTGGAPEHVRSLARDALSRGYTEMKVHDRSPDVVAAAREIVGDKFPIMLDVNCAWTRDEALDMLRRLERYNLVWVEEPTYPAEDFRAMASLVGATRTPIAAGENLATLIDFEKLIDARGVDIIQPDITKVGGFTETWKVIRMARERGVRCDIHSPYYGPGLIASLHLIAAMPEESAAEFFFADLEASPIGDMTYPKQGRYQTPDAPGLGIEVDEKLLKRYRVN